MKESRLRTILGVILLLGPLGVIGVTVAVGLTGGMLFDEMTTTVALLTPMFAVHTTTAVKYFVATKNDVAASEGRVTGVFAFLSICVPSLFLLYLITAVLLRGFNLGLTNFNHMKAALGIGQTCFAVYLGLVLTPLFEKASSVTASKPTERPKRR